MNRHRWAEWLDDPEAVSRLWAARTRLKSAWNADQEDPTHYPINTSWALAEIEQSFRKVPRENWKSYKEKWLNPKSLSDLVPEDEISAMWEAYNSGTFKETICRAAEINFDNVKNSWKASRRLFGQ